MGEYTYPGVYVKERAGGPGPIRGVSSSNLGLIGWTEKGPAGPTLVTSFTEYVSKFGTFTANGIAPTTAYAFFQNGGQRLYMVRVAPSDAVDAYYDLIHSILSTSPQSLGNTVEASGIYSFNLANPPVKPTTVVITFNHATTDNIFTDAAGDGVLTKTSGGGAGGSGTINYTTGEVSITLTDPSDYTGGSDTIDAVYDYTIFRFEMAWPGAMGNYHRVIIEPGDSDFLVQAEARYTRFSVSVQEDTDAGVTGTPNWTAVEEFKNLDFDTATSSNYIATVINAETGGSDYITVVEYGNQINPAALAGTAVTAEDFSATMEHSDDSTTTPPGVYDGMWQGWKYDLANGVFPKTFNASFTFSDGAIYDSGTDDTSAAAAFLTDSTASWEIDALIGMLVYNTTDGSHAVITDNTATTITGTLAGGTADTWTSGDAYQIKPKHQIGIGPTPAAAIAPITSPGNATTPASVSINTVKITIIDSVNGEQVVTDDGTGKLMHPDGAGPAVQIGTIDYTTGQIADLVGPTNDVLNLAACTGTPDFVAGSQIYFACEYGVAVSVVDDGNGNLALNTTQATGYPQKYTLDSNGTNSAVYATGVFTLTWSISGAPGTGPGGASAQTATYYTESSASITGAMASGSDGSALTSSDLIGASLTADQRGIWAFGKVDENMQLVAADFQTDVTVGNALITYAEQLGDKFVILTAPAGLTASEISTWRKYTLNNNSSYAAAYCPHIKIKDPVTNVIVDFPCGGHIAGIYARTDRNKNVGKAPAGVEDGKLNWAEGLELNFTKAQVGIVNADKVNALVQWPNTGRCVWGARSLDIAGGEYPYIQQRRTMQLIKKSIHNATYVHVFKNNGPALWSAITTQVTNYLTGLYQAGYFAGTSPAEAFFVVCDRSNNPQNTVDQGLVFCDVGIATNKPAEFIEFTFEQKTL